MIDLDTMDLAILRLLAQDATRSAAEIGRRLGIGQPAAWRRVKRLTEQGVLAGRRVELDQRGARLRGDGVPGDQAGGEGARRRWRISSAR